MARCIRLFMVAGLVLTMAAVSLTAVSVAAPPIPASAQESPPVFDVELLARPPGFQSVPFDINDDGVAVGYYLDFSLNYRSIMWTAEGSPVDLAAPGTWSQAHGIASDGTIAGYEGPTLQSTRPSLYTGAWSPVRLRRGYSGGTIEAVNANGWSVGSSFHTRTRSHRPALWRNNRMRVLASSGYVSDINDDRISVGWTNVNGFPRATAWNRTTLVLLEGADRSRARSISANGLILGSTPDPITNAARPAVWTDLTASPYWLGDLDGVVGSAADINSAGLVVGTSSFDPYNLSGDAVLWTADGVAHDLNDLIPAGSGWQLVSAVAINDQGQILGFGSCSCASGQSAFLLTPQS